MISNKKTTGEKKILPVVFKQAEPVIQHVFGKKKTDDQSVGAQATKE